MAHYPDFLRDVRLGHRLGLTTDQLYALSPEELAIQIAEWETTQGICSHCGNPVEKCSDPKVDWFPQRVVCYSTMERMSAQQDWDKLHEERQWHDGTFKHWSKIRTKATPYQRNWGVTIFASDTDLGLGGDFLGRDKKP